MKEMSELEIASGWKSNFSLEKSFGNTSSQSDSYAFLPTFNFVVDEHNDSDPGNFLLLWLKAHTSTKRIDFISKIFQLFEMRNVKINV